MSKFEKQYDLLGLQAPANEMDPREKADIIFHAACKKEGYDPAALPVVHHLPEFFQVFPVVAFKLEVIAKALADGKKFDWNNTRQYKWGAWFWMNKPGFRFGVSCYSGSNAFTAGGSRLCCFEEEIAEFFAVECIALWADFCGGELPA